MDDDLKPNPDPDPDPNPDPITGEHQDSFHKVVLGQVSDPLVRPHPEPPETEEDELIRAALGDPNSDVLKGRPEPTAWRLVLILLLGAIALGIVFRR